MIKEKTKDVLIKMGMPVSIRGFKYIPDFMELFDAGYEDAKITGLYADVAKKHGTTGSRVERAIRHSFETLIAKGRQDLIGKYLSLDNTTNSNMLKLLYYRLKQEETEDKPSEIHIPESDPSKGLDPYKTLEDDMVLAVQKFVKHLREENVNACSKVG
ncbi:sporulation initiation factor Spo0A C-terminal domain-containing protein [Lacrimispora sp.]|uniref:sporulation initiation factor Spo0A C-terminal domain-containing protein n=1 Tax=Lacrimispora sp. TaxID=2719234 RepID=UPI003995CA70